MFRNQKIVEQLNRHKIFNDYVQTSSGFPLESAIVTANLFQEHLLGGDIFGNGALSSAAEPPTLRRY
jgi:hypothetical protein